MLQNPKLGRLLSVAHALVALLCLGFLAFLILALSDENPPNADERIGAMLLVSITALLGVISVVVSIAVWKRRRWGWVLGYVTDVLVTLIMLFGIVFDPKNSGSGDWLGIAVFLPLSMSFYLPGVRSYVFVPRTTSLEN